MSGARCELTIIFVFFILIGIVSVVGEPNTSQATVTKPPDPHVVETQNPLANRWELKLFGVEKLGKKLQWSDYGKIEEASGTWLVVHLSLKNTAGNSSSLHPSNFRVIDSQGTIYNHYSDYTITEMYELYRGGQQIVNKIVDPSVKGNFYSPSGKAEGRRQKALMWM